MSRRPSSAMLPGCALFDPNRSRLRRRWYWSFPAEHPLAARRKTRGFTRRGTVRMAARAVRFTGTAHWQPQL